MIQFNLLPDVKLEFMRAQYRKRIITSISVIASGAALVIFVLLFLFVRINQTRHIGNLDKDIDQAVASLQSREDLSKVLTIQSQLASLPSLHDEKAFTSRLFDYMTQLTPTQATVSNIELDVEANTLVVKGQATDISIVNKFVDTIKFTEYSVADEEGAQGAAFSDVVLQNFSITSDSSAAAAQATYEISFSYDPVLFASTAQEGNAVANLVSLKVPKIISTRSVTETPSELFQTPPAPEEQFQQGGQ